MIIKADKEGIKTISDLVDVYLKHVGLAGLRIANQISASISEIQDTSPSLFPVPPVVDTAARDTQQKISFEEGTKKMKPVK